MVDTRQRGGALLMLVLFLALAVGGLSVALFEELKGSTRDVQLAESEVRALEIAETGIAAAEAEVASGIDVDGDGVGVVRRTFGGGTFAVDAVRNGTEWTLVSTGRLERAQRILEQGLAPAKGSIFNSVIFSAGAVTMSGTAQTDSYDSRLGTYAEQAVHADTSGVYAGQRGSIGSNGAIALNGSPARVRGDAIPGPVSMVSTNGTSTVTGSTTPRSSTVDLPPPPLTEFAAAWVFNDNDRRSGGSYNPLTKEMKVEGGATLTLTSGTYFFSKLTLSGGSTLKTTGKVTIYVTQGVDSSGGSLQNTTGRASDLNLVVYPHPFPLGTVVPKPPVKFSGGSASYMTVYAPKSPLTISAGEVFGSFMVGSATLSGNAFAHYDEALAAIPGKTPLEETYWTERRPPLR